LFISAAGVGLLLRRRERQATVESPRKPASELVQTASRLLMPMVFLFGVYVFVNGHLTPGGGFQGGAIIASGVLLLLLALPQPQVSHGLLAATESLSGFSYVLVGVLGVVLAGGFLDNRILPLGDFGTLFSAGAIPIIYIFVGLKVGSELSAVLDRFR
jgi:multicomponent Na+:H+ antiporter subunit B